MDDIKEKSQALAVHYFDKNEEQGLEFIYNLMRARFILKKQKEELATEIEDIKLSLQDYNGEYEEKKN